MTAKEYLEQVRHKQAEIGNLKRDKEAVKDMLYSLGEAAKAKEYKAAETMISSGHCLAGLMRWKEKLMIRS